MYDLHLFKLENHNFCQGFNEIVEWAMEPIQKTQR